MGNVRLKLLYEIYDYFLSFCGEKDSAKMLLNWYKFRDAIDTFPKRKFKTLKEWLQGDIGNG